MYSALTKRRVHLDRLVILGVDEHLVSAADLGTRP
jgi:hypothetical protein